MRLSFDIFVISVYETGFQVYTCRQVAVLPLWMSQYSRTTRSVFMYMLMKSIVQAVVEIHCCWL